MSKLVSRFYRDPADARQAIDHLIASGYKAHDISILARTEEIGHAALSAKAGKVAFHKAGDHVACGPLATALKGAADGKLAATLKESLGVTQETGEYFEFGIGTNGVLVAVQTDDAKATEVHAILGSPPKAAKPAGNTSPGFGKAPRMSATNPVDATMTGDFRKY